jgi:hypothetical protein
LIAVAGGAWWFRGTVERSRRDGLQTEIKGRDAIINGRDAQITGLQQRLDLAKEQQSYLAKQLDDAQAEIAKLKQQIADRAAPELLRVTANSTATIIGQAASANNLLGKTITPADIRLVLPTHKSGS